MEGERSDGGGGGGGAPPAGGGGGNAGLSQEQIDAVNGIVQNQIRRQIQQIPIGQMVSDQIRNALPEIQQGIVNEIRPLIEARGPGQQGAQPGQQGGQQGAAPPPGAAPAGGGALPPEVQNAIAEMQASLKSLQTQVAEKDAQIEQVTAERKRAEEDEALRGAFKASGVSEHLIEGAVSMFRGRGLLKRDDNGQIFIPKQVTEYGHSYTKNLSVPEFIKDWTKTDEGKAYLPARPRNGQVDQQGGGAPRAGGIVTPPAPPTRADGSVDMAAADQKLNDELWALAHGEFVDDTGGA